MTRKKRRWEEIVEDDPVAGMVNLFDVWIAFAVALLLAMVTCFNLPELLTKQSEVSLIKNAGTADMEIIKKKGVKIERYRVTPQQLRGEGQRLGTAYRLKSGEVVYVPENLPP